MDCTEQHPRHCCELGPESVRHRLRHRRWSSCCVVCMWRNLVNSACETVVRLPGGFRFVCCKRGLSNFVASTNTARRTEDCVALVALGGKSSMLFNFAVYAERHGSTSPDIVFHLNSYITGCMLHADAFCTWDLGNGEQFHVTAASSVQHE